MMNLPYKQYFASNRVHQWLQCRTSTIPILQHRKSWSSSKAPIHWNRPRNCPFGVELLMKNAIGWLTECIPPCSHPSPGSWTHPVSVHVGPLCQKSLHPPQKSSRSPWGHSPGWTRGSCSRWSPPTPCPSSRWAYPTSSRIMKNQVKTQKTKTQF